MATLSRLVSFDAASTLIDVRWTLDGFARDCMTELGLEVEEDSYLRLLRLYQASLGRYWEANASLDADVCELFWRELTSEWFAEIGVAEKWVNPSREASRRLMFDPQREYFRLYPDVDECLRELEKEGYRLAVISNWDYTLHPILRALGIYDRFELVLASLEVGVEKPDPRIFEVCLTRLGASAADSVHVGDDPVDDGEGALRAGMRPIMVLRKDAKQRPAPAEDLLCVTSLSQVPEVVRSIG